MIRLNLISQVDKDRLNKERLIMTTRNVLSSFLVVVIFIGILFLVSRIYLQNNYHQVVSQLASINMRNKSVNDEIKSLNSDLKKVDNIQAGFIKWSRVLVDFFALIPENNQLLSLNIDRNAKQIKISGRSLARDNLLKLKDNLENSELLKDVESPLSNLLAKEKVDFSFSAIFEPPQAQ